MEKFIIEKIRNKFFPNEKNKIKSDTQIILKLFEKFGISFVEKLRGIFFCNFFKER